jgi:hypothetical protein
MKFSSQEFLAASKSLFFIGLTAFLFLVYDEIHRFNVHLQEEITLTRTGVTKEITITRAELLSRVDVIQTDLRSATNKIDYRLASIENRAFSELATTRTDAFQRIDALHRDILPVRDSILTLSKTYNDVPAKLDERFGPYTDCKKNALCLQGQLSDTMFAVRTASRDIGSNSGVIASNFTNLTSNVSLASDSIKTGIPKIVQNSEDVTANLKKMTTPKWYDRIFTYAVSGSLLYFNIRGASAIASSTTK